MSDLSCGAASKLSDFFQFHCLGSNEVQKTQMIPIRAATMSAEFWINSGVVYKFTLPPYQ